jgi:Ca2+-binding RTX toxin-like protein
MSSVITVLPRNHDYIGALQWGGYVWTDTGVARDPVAIGYFFDNNGSAWTANERTAMANVFQSWANVANITFHETASAAAADLIEHRVASSVLDGDLGLHGTTEDAAQSSDQIEGGFLLGGRTYAHGYFNYQGFGWDHAFANGGLNIGGYGYWTALHEIGHGLGLAHPHDDGGGSDIFPGVTGDFRTGSNGLNQGVWTVMSYVATQSVATANTDRTGQDIWTSSGADIAVYGYYAGPMAFDIAAIQHLYGANTSFHNGNDTYVLPNSNGLGTYFTCIWDTGGTDSIRYNGSRDATISLVAATLDNSATGGGVISAASGVQGGFTIANGVVIENAYGGSGADTLTGNAANNILDGGGGADRMAGGRGDDTYYVDSFSDVVTEGAGRGNDWVYCYVTNYTLGANVENINYIGPTYANFTGTGNAANNIIRGWGGNDILNGLAGADTMRGYSGNDTFYVDNFGDVVQEENGLTGGNDWVYCYLTSYTLGANVENLNYIGTSTANFHGTGNAASNTIWGWAGNDTLNGLAGADTMRGFGGNDTFHVDNVGDVVQEENGLTGGNDWVYCYLTSYTLGANVEHLNYIGTTTANFTGTGNAANNTIWGWAGNDILNGRAGADTMRGFGGNDTFYVDNVGDVVEEAKGGGNDHVVSTASFSLAGEYIERLTLDGSAKINGTGNSLANTIVGNSAANIINGNAAADRMEGRAGNDRYYVDNAADVVIEAKGAGNDHVIGRVSFNLAGQHIEQLTLAGTGNINGIGNSLKNVIVGNSGSNVLNGKAGNDTLTGGGAADVFVFNTALNAATNVDTITDFQINLDKIRLDDAIFAQVGTSLTAGEFVANKSGAATTAAQNILYDTTDGRLFYDPDGNGAAARVHFATLKAGLALDHLDFVVV